MAERQASLRYRLDEGDALLEVGPRLNVFASEEQDIAERIIGF